MNKSSAKYIPLWFTLALPLVGCQDDGVPDLGKRRDGPG